MAIQRDKPYLRWLQRIADITVWVVDGDYIRTHIDKEFTNFGQHYRFPFIPKNEFWIDQQNGSPEEDYFITHLLNEHRFMAEGMSYEEALEKANKVEQNERRKSQMVRSLIGGKPDKHVVANYVHKAPLPFDKCPLRIWVVRGSLVRSIFYNDFTQGGHDLVYEFVPKNEIWLDDDLTEDERLLVLLHEVYERNLMAKGMAYDPAHDRASWLEYLCRHNRHMLEGNLQQEFSRAKLLE